MSYNLSTMNVKINIDKDALARFCHHWGIRELSLFGSALRADFSAASDIDLLVTFQRSSHPTLFDLVRMQDELGRLFNRRVDLVSRRGIERSSNYLRRTEILSTAQPLYAAAA
jgi:predicted nucleotidyltransferase